MVVEHTRYLVPADRHQEFEEMYRKASAFLRDSPHCLAYELTHCTEEPDRYMLRIEWKGTEAHLEGFRKNSSFRDFLSLVRPFISNIQEIRTMS